MGIYLMSNMSKNINHFSDDWWCFIRFRKVNPFDHDYTTLSATFSPYPNNALTISCVRPSA